MKRNDFILRLICIMCVAVLLCGVFAACGEKEDPQPTEAPTQAPTGEPGPVGPTEGPTDAPTEGPTEEPTEEPTQEPTQDENSSIMDGEDHVEIPFG